MAISEGTLAIGNRVMLPNGSTNNSLSELNDVNISNASDGQILVYDGTTNKWKNQNIVMPKYVKIAEATANQTFATQLTQLTSAFSSLTDEQKATAYLKSGNSITHIQDISMGRFSGITIAGSVYITTYVISTSKLYNCVGNFTVTDNSSNVNASNLELWVLM